MNIISDQRSPVFLATTALEMFWDTSRPMVFLSDACTRYSRKDIWQKEGHVILQSPLKNRDRYYKDYKFVQAFYERMLNQVGRCLNEIHGKTYSPRYWRIVLGFWLNSYIHVLYERYLSVKDALERYPGLTTILLAPEDYVVPRDTLDFVLLSQEDAYNLQTYSRILNFLGKDAPVKRHGYYLPTRASGGKSAGLKRLSARIGRLLARLSPVIARQPFVPRHKDKISFLLACGGRLWFDFEPDQFSQAVPIDRVMRERLAEVSVEAYEFEKLFLKVFPYEIPQLFVEGYTQFEGTVFKRYPFRPKAIWSATGWFWEEAFKFWAAACAEEGVVLAGMQHGGNYGMDLIHPPEEHETAINNRFYSWGWDKGMSGNIYPMPVTKYIGLKRLEADNRKSGILLATVTFPRYFYRYHTFRNTDYESYLLWEQRFMAALSSKCKALTRARLFKDDYGWDCRDRWHDFDSRVILEDWSTTFFDSMDNCRLHVSDHLSSTFVDALAVGKPTILFWDPEVCKVRSEAEPYMNDLRRVGILYDSPESAAKAVDAVYDDVEFWWNEPARQKVIKDFCHRYARTSPMALQEWAEEIKILSKGSTHVSG